MSVLNAKTGGQARKTNGGFTLIELMIVVLIIGLLAALIVPQFMHATERAKANAAKADLKTFQNALELFYADTGTYPDNNDRLAALVIDFKSVNDSKYKGWQGPYLKAKENELIKGGSETIIGWEPKDPWGNPYIYTYDAGKKSYTITAGSGHSEIKVP